MTDAERAEKRLHVCGRCRAFAFEVGQRSFPQLRIVREVEAEANSIVEAPTCQARAEPDGEVAQRRRVTSQYTGAAPMLLGARVRQGPRLARRRIYEPLRLTAVFRAHHHEPKQ